MRVKVTASLGVNQANYVAVTKEPQFGGALVVVGVAAVGVEEPIVVGILVVVASNLLLVGTLGVSLYVGVQKATIFDQYVGSSTRGSKVILPSVTHVLDSSTRANGDLEGAVLSNFCTTEIRLEERAHLRISGTAVGENSKVNCEAEHVDQKWKNDQAYNPRDQMGPKLDLKEKHVRMSVRRQQNGG